jgi:hypothetical protein
VFLGGVLDLLVVGVRIRSPGAGEFVDLSHQLPGSVMAEIEAGSSATINQVHHHHHRHDIGEWLEEADHHGIMTFGQDREGLAEKGRHAPCPGVGRNHDAVAVDRLRRGFEAVPRPPSIGADKSTALPHGATHLAHHLCQHACELVGIEETVVWPEQTTGHPVSAHIGHQRAHFGRFENAGGVDPGLLLISEAALE